MIDELDLLSQRIKNLVSKVVALSDESANLRQSLSEVTAERDELRRQVDAEKASRPN